MDLSKRQKQSLGEAIRSAGYEPGRDVVFSVHEYDDGKGMCRLAHRDTGDTLSIVEDGGDFFSHIVSWTEPGTAKVISKGCIDWDQVPVQVREWASEVRDESQAVDPWQDEAEKMANDDNYFLATELPKVDKAVDAVLEDLKQKALSGGKTLAEIQSDLTDIKEILKKNARTSTKREWMNILKGCVAGAIFDWGLGAMQAEILQSVIRTLITATGDVQYLAEHASRYIQ